MQFDSLAERLDEKNLPGEFPAECLSYTQPREGGTAPHRHDCMEIGLCVEGGGVLEVGDVAGHGTGGQEQKDEKDNQKGDDGMCSGAAETMEFFHGKSG